LTIDNLLPDPWPEDAVAALDLWRQGHLIRGELGTWLAAAGYVDPVTGADFTEDGEGLIAAVAEIGDTGYFAVVSQTCDIAATGPGRRHPFVQVCPVRNLGNFEQQKIQQSRDGELVEYVHLTEPPAPAVEWAIDLRISVPLSKGVLVASSPVVGFACQEDELAMAAKVAAKFERPALHDYLSKDFIDALNVLVAKARKASADWCEDIEQFRLEILEGDRLSPKRVRLVVITDVNFNALLDLRKKTSLRDHWKTLKKPLKRVGIEQSPIAFRYIEDLKAKDYRNSIPLSIPALGRGRFA
jgi:hypothetical protein